MLLVPVDDANMARGRFVYMIFMFLLFMMFSPSPPNPYRLMALEALSLREKHALESLHNATWIAPFTVPRGLNLTGVSHTPALLTQVNFTVPEYVRNTVASHVPKTVEDMAYYANITSAVRGKWHRIVEPNLNPLVPPEIPDDDERAYPRVFPAPSEYGNTTTYQDTIVGHHGKFSLELSEMHSNNEIQFVEVYLSLQL
jgi:hypothetical protein